MVDLCDTEVDGNEVHSDGDSIAPMISAPLQPLQKPDWRRSNCWTVFGMIDGPNVDPLLRRARCIYRKKATFLAKSSNGTSNMNKHMKICKPYIEFLKTTGAIPQFTQTRYIELVSKAIVRHRYAFSWVEHEGNREIHAYLNHEVQSITRNTVKADCLKLHKTLKAQLLKILQTVPGRICLTSDMWTSCQTEAMHLRELSASEDTDLSCMGLSMKDKFEKYWLNSDVCDVQEYNTLFAFALILDPRYKVQSLKLCFEKLYNDQDAIVEVANVMFKLKKLFVEYMPKGRNNSTEVSSSTSYTRTSKRPKFNLVDLETEDLSDVSIKSKLDLYLEEPRLNRDAELNILEFWGKNESKYGELSYMARDILSVPLTTVASESTFSIGGRILNKWRSSYLPENVEVLITTRSWIHGYEVQAMDEVECIGCEVEWATKE
ncbi:hypothetical protein POM88_013035 [Heracleum sosnowskyi]|uniref:Transposase n=1 Tax=Heracleum sosnowskyi TaxID=360622 RepID=A0AAD8N2A9_9APIA|nr:hypothetical protein POM88_013035 [Heracleum sosnowskyi]